MTDTTVTSTTAAPDNSGAAAQLSAEEARAKGQDLIRQSIKATDRFEARRLSDEAQKYFALATGGRNVGDPEVPADMQQQQQQQRALRTEQQQQQQQRPAEITDRAEAARALHDMTGGRLDYDQLEIITRDAGFWTRELETTLALKGEGAYAEAIEKGDAEVLRVIYGGNTQQQQAGLKDIVSAIQLAFGRHAPALIEQIDNAAALSNVKVHEQVLTWARAILKAAPQR